MAFSIVELLVVIIVCLLPFVMGLVLAIASVFQKTGTSDVLSWTSSGGSGASDPYQELQADQATEMADEEESYISDIEERRHDGLTRASASEYSSEMMSDRQSERDSDRRSDRMSEYTYDY